MKITLKLSLIFACILFSCTTSACANNSSIPVIDKNTFIELLKGVDIGYEPPIWVTSYSGGSTSYGKHSEFINTFTWISLSEKEREEFYQQLIELYEGSDFNLQGKGSSKSDGKEIKRSFVFRRGKLQVLVGFVYMGTKESHEALVGPRAKVDQYAVFYSSRDL